MTMPHLAPPPHVDCNFLRSTVTTVKSWQSRGHLFLLCHQSVILYCCRASFSMGGMVHLVSSSPSSSSFCPLLALLSLLATATAHNWWKCFSSVDRAGGMPLPTPLLAATTSRGCQHRNFHRPPSSSPHFLWMIVMSSRQGWIIIDVVIPSWFVDIL